MSIAPTPRPPLMTWCAYCGSPVPNHNVGCPVVTPQSHDAVDVPSALEQLARHFETGKFGKDKYLFPDEIAAEIREFSDTGAAGPELRTAAAKEILYAVLTKYVSQESIDEAWQEIKEAGIFTGVQPGAGERPNITIYRVEEDDENLWVRVPGADIASVKLNSKIGRALLTLEADLRAIRQAPHSSRETGS
jgi:hypothetical protein